MGSGVGLLQRVGDARQLCPFAESVAQGVAPDGRGQVQTRPLVSAILPITEWQAAFDAFERREGLKAVLTPI